MEDQELLHRYSVTDVLNKDFYSSLGLAHGKMRAVIFFFHCARCSGDVYYEEIAGNMLDRLLEELSLEIPLTFADGLCGIGWGIEYLIQYGFVEGDTDEILAEIDQCVIYAINYEQMSELGLNNGILGLGRYILMRLRLSWQGGDTYSSIELKENLIYFIDWIDRKLDGAGNDANDLLDWLLELRKTEFYKTKVDRMINKIS